MCRRFDTIPACDRQTDGQTDGQTHGVAVASTALAMRALRRAVKRKTQNVKWGNLDGCGYLRSSAMPSFDTAHRFPLYLS